MWKAIRQSDLVQGTIGAILGAYMALVRHTTRWTWINRDIVEAVWAQGGPVILCVWHGRVLLTVSAWPLDKAPKTSVLISQSPDGAFVSHAARWHGIHVVRGSKGKKGKASKGGVQAFLAMLAALKEGQAMTFTPDGPRGPRMRVSEGVIKLAQHAQAPLLPVAWSTRFGFTLGSWDRYLLALPFGPGVILWEDPLPPPPKNATDDEIEQTRLALETRMIDMSMRADQLAGRIPVAPEPLPVDNTIPLPQTEAARHESRIV